MAICDACRCEMTDDAIVTCKGNLGVLYPDNTTLEPVENNGDHSSRCHDCNVASGGYHHPGCDAEECPRCNGQLISCNCFDDDEYYNAWDNHDDDAWDNHEYYAGMN